MKKRILLICLLCVSQQFVKAQQVNLDSLWTVWQDAGEPDSNRLNAICKYAVGGYLFSQPDSAFYFAQLGYDLAKKVGNQRYEAEALHVQGTCYHVQSNVSIAKEYYTRSLAIKTEIDDKYGAIKTLNNLGVLTKLSGNVEEALGIYKHCLSLSEDLGNKEGVSSSLLNIGMIYHDQGNHAKAADYYTRTMVLTEERGDARGLAKTLNFLGVLYDDQGEDHKALDYHSRSLAIMEDLKDKRGMAESHINLGAIYFALKKHDMAIEHLTIGSKNSEEIGDQVGIAMCLINLALVYEALGEYETALDYHVRSLALSEKMESKKEIATTLSNIGSLYLRMNRNSEAIDYALRGMRVAEETGLARLISLAAGNAYSAYKATAQQDKALEMYELHIKLRDSMMSEDNQREVLRQEYKYVYEKEALTDSLEFVKKEAVMIERTEKQRIGLFAAGGGLLMVLALAFVIYSGKKKSDELLLNILPAEVANELKAKGHADAKQIDEVTVLFTDFKGFTALAEKLTAKELVDDLNVCFSAFDRIMEKYGIEKIKTIGDAYMAAGGLPTPNNTHASDVVNAAMEMRDFVEAGKAEKLRKGLPFFEVRIGIHTGPVVAGIVGIKKFSYDIWGDTVNTASRMESSGEAGKVNVSETTYELVKNQFSCDYRGEVEAKGKGKLKMYFVENV